MTALRTATCLIAVLLAAPVSAADLKVISAGAVRGVVGGMIEDYAQKSGHKFQFTVGPTGLLGNVPINVEIGEAALLALSR